MHFRLVPSQFRLAFFTFTLLSSVNRLKISTPYYQGGGEEDEKKKKKKKGEKKTFE